MKLFAGIVVENQLNAFELCGAAFMIGSRQGLLQTVAWKVAQCIEGFNIYHTLMISKDSYALFALFPFRHEKKKFLDWKWSFWIENEVFGRVCCHKDTRLRSHKSHGKKIRSLSLMKTATFLPRHSKKQISVPALNPLARGTTYMFQIMYAEGIS